MNEWNDKCLSAGILSEGGKCNEDGTDDYRMTIDQCPFTNDKKRDKTWLINLYGILRLNGGVPGHIP